MNFSKILYMAWFRAFMNLKSDALKTNLSYLWWVLEPLIQMACYYTVFELLLQRGGPGYVNFLMVGLVSWLWFSKTINQCSLSIVAGRGLIGNINLPKILFPLTIIIQCLLRQIPIQILLMVFLLVVGVKAQMLWIHIIPLMLVQIILILPIAAFAALIVVFVRDLRYLIPTALQFLFFFSGIFFDISKIESIDLSYIQANPMLVLIDNYRAVTLRSELPDYSYLFWLSVISVIIFGILINAYIKLDKVIARRVHE